MPLDLNWAGTVESPWVRRAACKHRHTKLDAASSTVLVASAMLGWHGSGGAAFSDGQWQRLALRSAPTSACRAALFPQ